MCTVFTIDKSSPTTLFEQLHSQAIAKIESGEFIAGTKLLQLAATEYAARARALGIDAPTALDYVRTALG